MDLGAAAATDTAAKVSSTSATSTNMAPPASAMEEVSRSLAISTATSPLQATSATKDHRIDEVVSVLGEFMPSDPSSPLSSYTSGFMSLRLLLLRSSRSQEEEELVRTMLDSFSSYGAGGRTRSDIAVMLARDFMFLSQQSQRQPSSLGFGQAVAQPPVQATNASNMPLFDLPPASFQNSPTLTPIPAPRNNHVDSITIISDSNVSD